MARAARSAPQTTPARGLSQTLAQLRTVPNALTLLRLALIPVFLAAYLGGEVKLAVVVFAVASVSDLADGVLARLLNQATPLGAILDPIADKALNLAALAALVGHGRLPAWLLALSLARDGVVLAVALFCRWEGLPAAAAPTRLGKYATFFTNLAVVLALVGEIAYASALAGYLLATALIAGECLVVAAAQYAGRFVSLTRASARSR